jgi:hypothetical protein
VAAAGGAGGATGLVDRGVQALGAATADEAAPGRGEDAWRSCGEDAFRVGRALDALEGPEVRAEAEALHERHRDEMRAWWEKYGEAPHGEEAQEALRALREQHREELHAMLEDYGVEVSEGARVGEGGRARGTFGAGDDGMCGHGRRGSLGGATGSW